jgi:hypothetical protein
VIHSNSSKRDAGETLSAFLISLSQASETDMDLNMEEQVRHRAYEIWECEGRPDGRAFEHWDQATRELAVSACSAVTPAEAQAEAVIETARPAAAPKTRVAKSKTPAKPPRQSAKPRQLALN